jgi:CRP-like cAMP-binding protein
MEHSANHLLTSLAEEKIAALLPHLKTVELPLETVLFETGDTIKTVYFPLSGVVSVVVDLATGQMIESAMIGRDSLVGGSAAFDNQVSLNRVVVQVTGAASALNVERFRELAQQSESFRFLLAASAAICGLQGNSYARRKAISLAAQVPRFARQR